MTFETYIQSKTLKLNDFQIKMLKVISMLQKEENVINLFTGKKACPYRILQSHWEDYRRLYPYNK